MALFLPSPMSKAVRLNRSYAYSLGWVRRFHQILLLLGFSYHCPGEVEFAEAVEAWQGANAPLTPDGILGPDTWRRMEPQTRFTPSFDGPGTPGWLRRPKPRKEATPAYVSFYHGTSRAVGEDLLDQTITPWLLALLEPPVRASADEWYKSYTDFGKGFYLFDESGRRNAFGRAKRRFADWGVVEFVLELKEKRDLFGNDLFYRNKSARPGNAPILPNSGGRPADWLQFCEWNRHVENGRPRTLREEDEDYTERYSVMAGPLWVPKDSGMPEGPEKSPETFYQYNLGVAGLAVLNRDAAKARRLLHTRETERQKTLEPAD